MNTQIKVIQDDINNGDRLDRGLCMIARAIKRAIPESYPRVGGGWTTRIEVKGKSYRPSPEIKCLIKDFDRGRPVAPFTLCLDQERRIAYLGLDLPVMRMPRDFIAA